MTEAEIQFLLDEIAAEIAGIKAWQAEIERKLDYASNWLEQQEAA